jgi:hypothetical protein
MLFLFSAYPGRIANLLGPQTVSPKAGARDHSAKTAHKQFTNCKNSTKQFTNY